MGERAPGAGAAESFPPTSDFRAALVELGSRLGVEIAWKGGPYRYEYDWGWGSATDAAEWEVELFTPILVAELGLYPPGFLASIGLDRIILARHLWIEQDGVAQNIAGYIFGRSLLASVSYTYKVNNRDKQRRYLHHLIWHQIDGRRGTTWEDPEWVALNPEGFEYGTYTKGGIHDRTSEAGLLSSEYPGFVNRYGTGNVPDDKADLFAYLMVVHHWVAARAEDDPYLRAKMAEIKRRLEELEIGLGAEFWSRVAAVRRDVAPYVTP